jgi:hypothetical protein
LGSASLVFVLLMQLISVHHKHWSLIDTLWSWIMPF